MKLSRLLIVPALAAGLAACAQDPYYAAPYSPYYGSTYGSTYGGYGGVGYGTPSYGSGGLSTGQTIGALGGAALGGLAGSQIGSGTGNLAATAGGAVLGALIGSQVGGSFDRQNELAAIRAQDQALITNAPITWNDPRGDIYGTVAPIRTYQSNGRYCREYVHTVYIDGRAREAQGLACQQADGSWQIVS